MNIKKKLVNSEELKKALGSVIKLYNSKQFEEALIKAKKLVKISPKESVLHNLIGLINVEKKNIKEGIKNFELAIKYNQNFFVAHNNLANLYKNNKQIDKAILYYKKAIKINPKSAEIYNNLANLYKSDNKIIESIMYYKKAISINPKIFIIHNNIGIAYKNLGMFSEAKKSFSESMRLKPDFHFAFMNFGLSEKWKEDTSLFASLQKLYNESKKNNTVTAELAFTLGKANDDINNYEESIKYFLEANHKHRKKIDYSTKNDEELFESIKSVFNKNYFNNTLRDNKIKKIKHTPIFIVGMPRSGTSLVEQILSNHKEIFGAGETPILENLAIKHFDYINNISTFKKVNLNKKNFLKSIGDEYLNNLIKISKKSKFITDKLPINFRWIGLIKSILPNAKIIHCSRNSKDVCLSIFKNYFPYKGMNFAYSLDEIIKYYNLYRNLMLYWNSILPNFIYEINYEQLIQKPKFEINSLLKFLNLKWDEKCLNFHNNKRAVHTASDAQVRKPIYKDSIYAWKSYDQYLKDDFSKLDDQIN